MSDKPVLGSSTYAGIPCVYGQFTLSHGTRPSAATIYFVRDQVVPPYGDLVIEGTDEFGNGNQITFRNCFADNVQATAGGDPLIVVRIVDRRWAWDFAAISGHYNIRSESGDSIYNEKSPRDLAILCLDVMGEAGYDLGDFNPDARPQIDWELVNPARALDELVNEFGYRIALGLDNHVHVFKAGVGDISFLDRFTWLEDTVGIDLPKRPDGIIVAGGRTLWNMKLWLEPVGLELNGEWKNIDKLSYKPVDGWESTCLPRVPSNLVYPADAKAEDKEQINQLAVKHIYRTYRICVRKPPHWVAVDLDGNYNNPPYGRYLGLEEVPGYTEATIKERWQLLPLEPSQNLRDNTAVKPGEKAGNSLLPKRKPPSVVGFFNSGNIIAKDSKQREALKGMQNESRAYKFPFDIDYDRGLVTFDNLMHCIIDKIRRPAMVWLKVASGVRDSKSREWKRHTIEQNFPTPLGAGKMVIAHEEVQLRYAIDLEEILKSDNKADVERELRYYLNSAIATLEQKASRSGEFAGILAIEPSGLVQQISWEWGSNGPKTKMSANTEHSYNVPNYYERRLLTKLKDDKRKLGGGGGGSPGSPGNGAPT